ncbi:Uncharacterised protein [Vibrio cholerae]|nr:Uncharacterised protein [Vibrio cholerae]
MWAPIRCSIKSNAAMKFLPSAPRVWLNCNAPW